MKKKILIVLPVLVLLILGMAETAKAQPDTLWTRKSDKITGAIFTLDGNKIIVGEGYKTMLLTSDSGKTVWDVDTASIINKIICLPDSSTYITQWYGAVISWNLNNGSVIKFYDSIINRDYDSIFDYHGIAGFCISDDGNYLYVLMSKDSMIYNGTKVNKDRLYKIDMRFDTLVSKRDLKNTNFYMQKISGQNFIITYNYYTIYDKTLVENISFISTESLAEVKRYKVNEQFYDESIYCMDVSRNGRYIVAGTSSNRLLIWDTQQDSLYRTIICDSDSNYPATKVTFANTDSIIIFQPGSSSGIVSWNINSNQIINQFPTLDYITSIDGPHAALCVSPDGTKVLIAGYSGLYMFSSGFSPIAHKQDDNPQAVISINPNPSEHKINIEFEMINPAPTKIMLYDGEGNVIKEIANRDFYSGKNKIEYDTKGLANGVYFIKFTNNQINKTEKIIIVR